MRSYERATNPQNLPAPRTLETEGALAGEGLSGSFHTWHDDERDREDQNLGPRSEKTLRLGERVFVANANGNVRELHGLLLRRSITARFIDSGEFANEPERSRLLGSVRLGPKSAYKVEVTARGGEPETLYIDSVSSLLLRIEYENGDGPLSVDVSDWRMVDGRLYPFHGVVSDGDHAFDVVQITAAVRTNVAFPADIFAPLKARMIESAGAQSVPLTESGGHFYCAVGLGGKRYNFLIDTGAQSILLDSRVVREAGLREEGKLEARGAARTGGLHVVRVPMLAIGSASLRDLVATSIDLGGTTRGVFRIDGILGYPFFASATVQLDFAHKTMTFGPSDSIAKRGAKLALEMDRAIPEADVRLNDAHTAKFIIDTGSGAEVLLYRPFVDAHPGIVPFTGDSRSSFGIGGSAPAYRTRLDQIELAGMLLYHRATDVMLATRGAFADRFDAGNIGLGVLRNFVVTFDESANAMYLEQGADFDDGRNRPQYR